MKSEKTLPNTLDAADRLLDMVGALDGDGGASHFNVVLQGELADAVMKSINANPEWYGRFMGKPVNVFRHGGLEINCEGFYTEGRGCRGFVHRGVAAFKESQSSTLHLVP